MDLTDLTHLTFWYTPKSLLLFFVHRCIVYVIIMVHLTKQQDVRNANTVISDDYGYKNIELH